MLPMLPSLTNLAQLDQAVRVAACDDDLIKLPSLPVCTRSSLWEQARAAALAAAAVLITGPHAKEGPSGAAARGNDAELEASPSDDGPAEAEGALAKEDASCTEPDMVRASTIICVPSRIRHHIGHVLRGTQSTLNCLLGLASIRVGTAMTCKT